MLLMGVKKSGSFSKARISAAIAALILALLKLPDFLTPINSISESLKKLTKDQEDAAPAVTNQSGEER